ncbi:formimidoylglutamate deiminase [Acidicapsa ligni]|uniref:formimidoylglutamate deiminase n=1 Tax=Acidicapsa ligni TaxID=542300 RepID=UPI0021DF7F7C|nr:formimidoylglutamate deiminase [Acidicapsa ligni]
MPSLYQPEILFAADSPYTNQGLLVDDSGTVIGVAAEQSVPTGTRRISMPGKALLPGLANAHSHTFQRLFRARAEGRRDGGDTFWTWREQMYRAAEFVSPDDLFHVARATFLEMLHAGITVVGEFHYLHRDAKGEAYSDSNLLSHQVIAAAQSVGIRISLLRTAYFRAGFGKTPHPGQRRFYEQPDTYLRNLDDLVSAYANAENVTVGAAPHSIRAVPLDELKQIAEYARTHGNLPLHMHISEQVGENAACFEEYGATPVSLVAAHGILSPRTTLIHAIHLTEAELAAVAEYKATICSCPTTERNLGDGIFPADAAACLGIPVAFGTDSQAQIDILEDARQLEYHLRLKDQQRGILDASARSDWASREPIGNALFRAASSNGYAALGLPGGSLAAGEPADFFTVDLNDLSILGSDAESILTQAVFASAKGAIRDVAVQGRLVLQDGKHVLNEDIRTQYQDVQRRYQATAPSRQGDL